MRGRAYVKQLMKEAGLSVREDRCVCPSMPPPSAAALRLSVGGGRTQFTGAGLLLLPSRLHAPTPTRPLAPPLHRSMGNIYGRLAGANPDAPAVATGSHTDAIPLAGAYDGTLGALVFRWCS